MEKCRALIMICLLGCVMAVKAATPMPPEGDPVRGKAIYAQCMGCHSPERHRTGPKHCGLPGRKAGTSPGYQYSKAMQQADIIWTPQTLDDFLYAPLVFVPGTRMGIAGIKNDENRRDLIAYLMTMNGQHGCH